MSSRQVSKQICLKAPGLVVISARCGGEGGSVERERERGKIKIRKPFVQEYCIAFYFMNSLDSCGMFFSNLSAVNNKTRCLSTRQEEIEACFRLSPTFSFWCMASKTSSKHPFPRHCAAAKRERAGGHHLHRPRATMDEARSWKGSGYELNRSECFQKSIYKISWLPYW